MDSRTLKALEFGKVLDHLAQFCLSEAGREACLGLVPLPNVQQVFDEQTVYEDARTWAGQSENKLCDFPDLSALFPLSDTRPQGEGASSLSGSSLSDARLPGSVVSTGTPVPVNVPGTSPLNAVPPLPHLDADALWAIRTVLVLARRMVLSINEGETVWPMLFAMAHEQPLPDMAIAALTRCLGEDGSIRDESSPELMLVRGELRRLHQGCLHRVKDFAKQYNIGHYLQDEYMTLASDRYVLPLKSNFKGRIQGIIHDYSNTGETCYFEPLFLVEQNNRIQELKQQEREEERKVVHYLAQLVHNEWPFVGSAWRLLVRLDVQQAKARLAEAYAGVCVTVTPPSATHTPLSLLQARHPLLVLDPAIAKKGGPHPLDLVLREGDRALVISGGNAGGKTVCLKTLGLMVAMTLTGLPVPVAKGSVMPWWPLVHAFIGDEQSLDDHVSTFTAQIRYLARAWDSVNSQALVLLDEFGAGTDPAQGAALAQAVIDQLLEKGAHVVAATHFPALKTYALTRDLVRAASVLFDPATKRPLFCLAYDQVGASQALDVAREHGLPEEVVRRAEQYLLLDGQDMSAVMDRLNTLAAQREKELEALHEEQKRAREKRLHYQERFEKERTRLHTDVQAMASDIMAAWKDGRVAAKQALKELSKVRANLKRTEEATVENAKLSPEGLIVGQRVVHRPWGKEAVVREVDARQNRVKLDMNGVTLWADMNLLETVQGAGTLPTKAHTGIVVRTSSKEISLLHLDLRGKRADLALSELSQFLDRALLSSMEGVEIIHGRGTGALRKEVHTFLRSFPGLAGFALAPEDQGGDGVTVVTFS